LYCALLVLSPFLLLFFKFSFLFLGAFFLVFHFIWGEGGVGKPINQSNALFLSIMLFILLNKMLFRPMGMQIYTCKLYIFIYLFIL